MNIDQETEAKLLYSAKEAMEKAYAPYSGIRVGAAFLAKDGSIYNGCNVENSSYGLTCCAERTAIFKAVTAGSREFVAAAIFSDSAKVVSPCGACRQVIYEFNQELDLVVQNPTGKSYLEGKNLLPAGFTLVDEK